MSHDPHAQDQTSARSRWHRLLNALRVESVGGALLLAATVAAMIIANVAPETYASLKEIHLGRDFGPLHLDLSLAHWAADGLLAIFFFMVGLELKQEFVAGDLRDPRRALVPMVAAACGVVVPAGIYVAIIAATGADAMQGWAIPTATDIAFVLAVLAVVGRGLPVAVRTFLLTLAVVDDLIAITIIAIFYSTDLSIPFLLATVVPLAVFGWVVRRFEEQMLHRRWLNWVVLLPLAFVAWALLYNSGIHATVAGVLLAFTVPVLGKDKHAATGLSKVLEHRFRPLSTGVAVPIFAFFAAGVTLNGADGLAAAAGSPVVWAIAIALVVGKTVGITGGTFLLTRLPGVRLDSTIRWVDLAAAAMLAGIGFTVSLLIAELSFTGELVDLAKIGVLAGSSVAAVLGGILLAIRSRHHLRTD
ncbi:Na+/H+ antiporter NhaA [Parenemella sanctibonifatiensis]|uniref:Na(+)/H(+) antiporter NhaA n=1 Tax=Parenemella sanctibonifatiensis TaxID=2016505 RepID=A0A255E7V8_9ACTN|nr:Na+/H+ antiporter NhaA [Parenemella sanctibonifatiensis]OYN87667.1 Na+/H+ antiporter NhaA [Parenemella sanctibonifatiensis]